MNPGEMYYVVIGGGILLGVGIVVLLDHLGRRKDRKSKERAA